MGLVRFQASREMNLSRGSASVPLPSVLSGPFSPLPYPFLGVGQDSHGKNESAKTILHRGLTPF